MIISMLSRVTSKEDDFKFQREFIGFISVIGNRQRIRWSKVISDSVLFQLAHIGSSRKFYMNSYLVFLLLHGTNRRSTHAYVEILNNPEKPVWRAYPKWWLESRWDYYTMKNDG